MTPRDALLKAINTVGTQTALAAAIGPEIKTGHVYHWLNESQKVPAQYCPSIEQATRLVAAEKGDVTLIVTCEELCPGVEWGVLRSTSAPAAERSEPEPRQEAA